MLIFTNRKVQGKGPSARFSRAFTPVSGALSFATAEKSPDDKWNLKGLKSDTDDVAAVDALAAVFRANRPVLVYLHGNNNTPERCFERCAVLERMYNVEVVGFSWPSEGALSDGNDLPDAANDDPGNEDDLGGITASNRTESKLVRKARRFRQAKVNAQESVDALARFLRLVSIARLQANAQPFSLAVHSLGVHFLQYSLEIDTAREALGAAFNVALVAGCARASGHKDWVARLRPKGKVFITYNSDDIVLYAAFVVDGSQLKLGADPGTDRVQNGLTRYICFSNAKVGAGGHGYFVYDKLPKKARSVLTRVFQSETDIRVGESPAKIYPVGCDADGVTCYVGLPTQRDND